MNGKTRALLVLFLFLAVQLACASPLPGQNGAQGPAPVYTFTSLPPFPTATVKATDRPTASPIAPATLLPSSTPLATPTRLPTLTYAPHPRANTVVIARYLSTPPKIDGDWGEWKSQTDEYPANYVVSGSKDWTGVDDLSASFHLGWDDNNFYLAIKVRDAQYVQNWSGAEMFNGDSLELLLDTQLMADYLSTQLDDDDFQLGISAGHSRPGGGGREAYLWAPNYLAGEQPTVDIRARQEPGFYRVEAAIPWAVFEMKPVAGQHYGFALSVSDNDNGDGSVQQSMISNLAVRHPGDPTTWGDMQLVK